MTVSTPNVIAPVLATTEVVSLLFASVTRKTSLGDFLRRFVLEGNDLFGIAFFRVGLAWAMTGFATSYLVFPTANRRKRGVGSVREGFELIFMAGFAGFAADVIFGVVTRRFDLAGFDGLRRTAGSEPHEAGGQRAANAQRLDDFIWIQPSASKSDG